MLAVLGLGIAVILAYSIYSSTRSNYGHSHQAVVEAHRYHLSGNEKHSQGDIDGALEDYTTGLKIAPRYVPLLMARANICMEIGEFDSALHDCSIALNIEPQHTEARYQRAKAYEELGKLGEAKTDYDFLIDKFDDFASYIGRYEIYLRLKQFDNALADAEVIGEKAGESWAKHAYCGEVYFEKGDYEKAIIAMTVVMDNDIDNDEYLYTALSMRCWAYYSTREITKGMVDAQAMVDLQPQNHKGYHNIAYGYQLQKQYIKALENYQRAYELNPEESQILLDIGLTYFHLQQNEKSQEMLTEYMQAESEQETAYLNRGGAYGQMQQRDKAISDYTKVIELNENNALAYNNRSWAKAVAGSYDQMLEDAHQAIKLEPEEASYYSTRGQAHWLLGDYESALTDFEHAQKLDPEHVSYLAEAAVAQFMLQRNAEAVQLWQQIQVKAGKSVTAEELQTEYGWAQSFYEAMRQVEALAKGE